MDKAVVFAKTGRVNRPEGLRCIVLRLHELKLPLDHASGALEDAILRRLKIPRGQLTRYQLIKRSIDARRHDQIMIIYSVDVCLEGDEEDVLRRHKGKPQIRKAPDTRYNYVVKVDMSSSDSSLNRPVVVGAGPCGYFAALLLAQMGFRPLLLERGREVKARALQTFGFWKGRRDFDPESNVQFGEGGAGTFSDGKLYSQVSDPEHYGRKVLEELVASGANPDILCEHRPHIGTYRLAKVVRGLRARIEDLGGEIRFESRMKDLLLDDCRYKSSLSTKTLRVSGVKLADETTVRCRHLVLAPGHSARDTFFMLQRRGVVLEAKPFSVGFRIEHPQGLINRARWGAMAGHPLLGPAEYKLVHHASNGRCVYSFCMCPGGLVVGATSETDKVVTNGMSQYSRKESNANSGLVVNLMPEDVSGYGLSADDPLAGVGFQRELEKRAFRLGGGSYFAPAQRLEDFLAWRSSSSFGSVSASYQPGVTPVDLNQLLPQPLIEALHEAIPVFARRLQGYDHPDAVLTGVETRTSSPVRMLRDESFESCNVDGLFPAGEGAGYAGGILSAGIDGIKVAESLARRMVAST